jgi:hypothetical protein
MTTENEDSPSEMEFEEESEVDWKDYVFQDDDTHPIRPLDATDYVALFIASLQTIFLPLIILIIVLLAFGFIFTIFY